MPATRPYGPYDASPLPYLAMFAITCGTFVSTPAIVLGIALVRVATSARVEFSILAPLPVAWTALSGLASTMRCTARSARLCAPERWSIPTLLWLRRPHMRTWWLLAAPLCFALALGIAIMRRRSVEELGERHERRADRARAKAERKARRALGVREPRRRDDPTFELGQHIAYEHVLPDRQGRVLMPLSRLQRTALVIGAPGSGMTVTLRRLAYGVATVSDWQVIVIDAKGDQVTQQQFAASMRRADRSVRLFPQEPYDAWRGSGREIANQLVQLIDGPTRAAAPTTATSPTAHLATRLCWLWPNDHEQRTAAAQACAAINVDFIGALAKVMHDTGAFAEVARRQLAEALRKAADRIYANGGRVGDREDDGQS